MSDKRKPSHKSSSVYNDLRLEGAFCDAVIKVEDVEFQIHKVILCKCSPYFRALFRRWSTPDKKVFDIPGLSPDMMHLIIEFAYTGSVSVTEDNAQELLLAADQFSVMDVVQTCCDFLEEQLCPNNCTGIWQFTNICFSSELQRKAYRYIIDHFEEVVSCEEFLQLSVQELTKILDRDDLNVRKESTVCKAIIYWISHLPEEREAHVTVLMSKVRLALTSVEDISMCSVHQCLHMPTEVIPDTCRILTNKLSVSVTVMNECIYAMGGYDGHIRLSTAERYRPETNQWSLIAPMHEQRSDASCTTLHNKVYICGGFNGKECLQTCEYYSQETNQSAVSSCFKQVGGFDGSTRLHSAEAYNPLTNTWHAVPSMLTPRSNFGIEVINDQLFVVGGFNGFTTTYNVEYYDATIDKWSEACDMEIFRSALSCCVVPNIPNMANYLVPRDALTLLHLEEESVESGDSI